MKILLKLFRKQIIQALNNEKKPDYVKSLVLRFEDGKHKYYGFPENLDLPPLRFIEDKRLFSYELSSLTVDEAGDIIQMGMDAINDGLKDPKNLATVTKLFMEMERRQRMFLQPDLMINRIANRIIRDDENPEVIDRDIHQQKADYFKTLLTEETGFFFQLPELKVYKQLRNLSHEERTLFFLDLILKETVNRQSLQNLKLQNEERKLKKTLKTAS